MARKGYGEKRDRQVCIAMSQSEFKLVDNARRAVEESKGRQISMREFVLLLCRGACYEPTTIGVDAESCIADTLRMVSRIKLDLAEITKCMADLRTVVEKDAETEE